MKQFSIILTAAAVLAVATWHLPAQPAKIDFEPDTQLVSSNRFYLYNGTYMWKTLETRGVFRVDTWTGNVVLLVAGEHPEYWSKVYDLTREEDVAVFREVREKMRSEKPAQNAPTVQQQP